MQFVERRRDNVLILRLLQYVDQLKVGKLLEIAKALFVM